jgi:hypothetical protein
MARMDEMRNAHNGLVGYSEWGTRIGMIIISENICIA